jgi:hypothetical protein
VFGVARTELNRVGSKRVATRASGEKIGIGNAVDRGDAGKLAAVTEGEFERNGNVFRAGDRDNGSVSCSKPALAGTMQSDRSSLLDLLPICLVSRRLRILYQYAPTSLRADGKNLLRNDFPPDCILPA